jgi:RNA polymerase sigma factor (sigma-70 family)
VARLVDIQIPQDLLERALAGEEEARVVIYTVLAPATFALIRRLVDNRAAAEDLFQEAMMAVFERLSGFRGEAPVGAWVRQIAISKCLMFLRSPWHRMRLRVSSVAGDEEVSLDLAMLTVQAPSAETFDVERALASLSSTARAVVWLYEVEGYSHEEIARLFGRSISFSKSQLARAHVKLREWFEPNGDGRTCTTIHSGKPI